MSGKTRKLASPIAEDNNDAESVINRFYLIDNRDFMASPLKITGEKDKSSDCILLKNAHAQILRRDNVGDCNNSTQTMSRYEKAEHIIHQEIEDLEQLQKTPIGEWRFIFFNNGPDLNFTINCKDKTLKEFISEAHERVSCAFSHPPTNNHKPLRNVIETALDDANTLNELASNAGVQTKVRFTLFTGGEPSLDRSFSGVGDCIIAAEEAARRDINLIKNRKNPIKTPICVWICNEYVKWVSRLERECSNVVVRTNFTSNENNALLLQGFFGYNLRADESKIKDDNLNLPVNN